MAVGLEARPFLRAPGEARPVGRDHRLPVGRGIGGGEVLGPGRAVEGRAPKVEVGAPGLACAPLGREDHRPAVGSDRIVRVVAEGLGRGVGVEAGHDVDGRPRRAVAGQSHREQVVARAVGPCVPVADEQPRIEHAGRLARGLGVEPGLGAGQALAIGEHPHGDHQRLAVRAQPVGPHVQGQLGDLHRLGAGGVGPPDLGGPGARGQEVDEPAVRRPPRIGGAAVRGGQSVGRRVLRPRIQQPQGVDRGVVVPIGGPEVIDHRPTVRRDVRIGGAIHHRHVLGRQGVGVGEGEARRYDHCAYGQGAEHGFADLARQWGDHCGPVGREG